MDRGVKDRITPEARIYALHELCRRAGLTSTELSKHWTVDVDRSKLTLYPRGASPSARGVVFPFCDGKPNPDLVVRKGWIRAGAAQPRAAVSDFVVPFCRNDSIAHAPLFMRPSPGLFCCSEDLLGTTALVLARYEELISSQRDEHGRFPSAASIAVRDGYLDRPIVDEYGLALEQILRTILPAWTPSQRKLHVKISHDIDQLGIPFNIRTTAGHFLKRKAFLLGLYDIVGAVSGGPPGYLHEIAIICNETRKRGLNSALYWKASAPGPFDTGYDIHDSRITRVMDWARSLGIELGCHPGYDTYCSISELRAEVQRCRAAIGNDRIGGRQHYLRWSPETWIDWEASGLSYDSSVGYADCVGFRAGTCWPYFPWIWNEDRRAELLEIPLIVMDCTLVEYMAKTPSESCAIVTDLVEKCRSVGGVFALLWHNSALVHPYPPFFRAAFDELAGIANYDWESDFNTLKTTEIGTRLTC